MCNGSRCSRTIILSRKITESRENIRQGMQGTDRDDERPLSHRVSCDSLCNFIPRTSMQGKSGVTHLYAFKHHVTDRSFISFAISAHPLQMKTHQQ